MSYARISSYCPTITVATLFLIPKPARISAVHPAIPITVIKNRFLYLRIFRAVTLPVKDILFQMKPIRSSMTFLPFFGDFGRSSIAGSSVNSPIHAAITATTVTNTAIATATMHKAICGAGTRPSTVYTVFHAVNIMPGNVLSPTKHPITPPVSEATAAYVIYFIAIRNLLYPSALSVPIIWRCSSTILVIVVRHTSAATR